MAKRTEEGARQQRSAVRTVPASLMGGAIDHPARVDAVILGLVALHAAATYADRLPRLSLPNLPNVWQPLISTSTAGDATTIYGALIGPAALLAGFAGVVVIYGLSVNSERFRKFRADAGSALRRTWLAASAAGFVASGFFIAAVLLNSLGSPAVAPWAFEVGLLVLVHGSLRLIWITAGLIGVTAADDIEATNEASKTQLRDLPFGPKTG